MADIIKVGLKWYKQPYFKIGDRVRRLTERKAWGNGPAKGDTGVVTNVVDGSFDYYQTPEGYAPVYEQRIKLDYQYTQFKSTSFEHADKSKKENVMQLEVDRPTLVQEFGETTVDGKAVRKNIGDPIPFDSASAARVWCTNQITSSIRLDNTYRKFSILTEVAVAQAKEPEIEFK